MSEWKWWDHVFFYGIAIGIFGLIPWSDGTLPMPLWLSLPVVFGGGASWLFLLHRLEKH
jgi:hypothetical protein